MTKWGRPQALDHEKKRKERKRKRKKVKHKSNKRIEETKKIGRRRKKRRNT